MHSDWLVRSLTGHRPRPPLMAPPIRPYLPRHLTLLILFSSLLTASCASDTEVLIKFKASLTNADAALSSWNPSGVPCIGNKPQWVGLICSDEGNVWGLQIENMGLSGVIDIDTLTGLINMRTLSFMNNNFVGGMPNIRKLGALKNLYLSNNRFSGKIADDAFDEMVWLKKVYLAHNEFTGPIPSSVAKLPRLLELRLDSNHFTGKIPEFSQKGLAFVNVSNNNLHGAIPKSLDRLNSTMFSGNSLCGQPLSPCPKKKFSKTSIIIAIAVLVLLFALILIGTIVVILRRRRHQALKKSSSQSMKKPKKMAYDEGRKMGQTSPANFDATKKTDTGKLVFVRDDRQRFDLNDLLKASAEILGSGSFGSTYKAALLNGPVMVAKRFRQMSNVGKEEFNEHMRRLGMLRHPNLLPLVAYYYRKEEKLLVSDYVENGSLAHHLHGNRSPGNPPLDWPTRLNIIKGIANALTYLYTQLPSLTVAHGHLKSSNVLLNESYEPILTDYCLLPIVNKDHAIQLMIAYKSPEYPEYGRLTNKTDVWSLGILILELITGKFPENYLSEGKGGSNADLAKWVNSVVREEWTGEVFDKELKGTKNAEGEMLKLLKIALGCCEMDVESRWDLKEAVERIEEVRERNNDSDDFSSYASDGEMYSSKAISEDDFSFSMKN